MMKNLRPSNHQKNGVSIVIPTLNGGDVFSDCLSKIKKQEYDGQIQLLVIDSGSTDDTLKHAKHAGAQVFHVKPGDFHHAQTRNDALSHVNYEHVIFMVQDALPVSGTWLSELVQSIISTPVEAVHVKQIPHDHADAYARIELELNAEAWGAHPRIQKIDSFPEFMELPFDEAYLTIRLDNVCAIYKTESLIQRPFPNVEFAEDLAWGYDTIMSGGRILYQPSISVKHSHNRPPEYRLKREMINSLALADIMKRVREDLSYVTVMDLILLSVNFNDLIHSFLQSVIESEALKKNEHQPFHNIMETVFTHYSLKNRIRKAWVEMRRKRNESSHRHLAGISGNLKAHLEYEYALIRDRTGQLSTSETASVVNIISARILGRLYGESYASKKLNHTLTPDFETFIHPFRGGV